MADEQRSELVIVQWEDTTNIAAWQTPEELAEWASERGWICQNVGWLVYQDEHCVVVAARRAWDQQRHLGLAERIPRKAILEITSMVGAVVPDPREWRCDCSCHNVIQEGLVPCPNCVHSDRGYDMNPEHSSR